jgi:hypothetical protein
MSCLASRSPRQNQVEVGGFERDPLSIIFRDNSGFVTALDRFIVEEFVAKLLETCRELSRMARMNTIVSG